jgi:hypothetical protein
MVEADRRMRAEARRARVVLRKSTLLETEDDPTPIRGDEAVSLVHRLTREAWSLAGLELPAYSRRDTPCRSRPAPAKMIELPEDFRDLLIELADAGAEFVVIGGHAVAFHGHPRATKDLDVLVRATPANAVRVFRALASFGAPLQAFDVDERDFSTYEGVLQIGVPPRRIDILNRADGISFDEATGSATPSRSRAALSRSSASRPC